MSRLVPAMRPELSTTGIKSGEPVTGPDWSGLAALANFGNGHGGMLIPWAAIGFPVSSGSTETFHFYIAPKLPAVERVWLVNMRSGTAGATAAVTVGSASAVTVTPETSRSGRTTSWPFLERLSAKTNTAGDVTVVVTATGGDIVVESIGCYEQTRRILANSTDDYGVDLTTLRPRQPIFDGSYESVAGVIDAYKNLDARRAGLFAWSTPVSTPIEITAGSYTKLFGSLSPPCLGAMGVSGTDVCAVRVCAYAKVDAGTGQVRFTADQEGTNTVLSITSTSFAWVVDDLDINAEDLSKDDGRRGAAWEGLTIEANDNTATTLSIAGLAVVRVTTPI